MYQTLDLNLAFTLVEPSPVVLITTRDQGKDNVFTVSGAQVDKFDRFGLAREEAKQVDCAIIKGCAAYIECRVVDESSSTAS